MKRFDTIYSDDVVEVEKWPPVEVSPYEVRVALEFAESSPGYRRAGCWAGRMTEAVRAMCSGNNLMET